MGIHKEGVRILTFLAVSAITAAAVLFIFVYWIIALSVTLVLLLLLLFVAHFFRRAKRKQARSTAPQMGE